MAKQRGNGLQGLVNDLVAANTGPSQIEIERLTDGQDYYYAQVPLEECLPSRFQFRKVFTDADINELAASIQKHGLLEPIIIQPHPSLEGKKEIIAGERRWRASARAGKMTCEAKVFKNLLPDERVMTIGLIENAQRKDLTPIEKANAYNQLREQYTLEVIATLSGTNMDDVDKHLALLRQPEDVQSAWLEHPDLPVRLAREIGSIKNSEDRAYLLTQLITGELKTNEIMVITSQTKKEQKQEPQKPLEVTEREISREALSIQETHAPSVATETMPGIPDDQKRVEKQQQKSKPQPSLAMQLKTIEQRMQRKDTEVQKILEGLQEEILYMNDAQRTRVWEFVNQWYSRLHSIVESVKVPQQ